MRRTLLYVIISTFMFSLMEIALKSVQGVFAPLQLNLIRFLIGGLVLLPIALKHRRDAEQQFNLRDILIFALTGFLCVIVSMTLYQIAIEYDEAATVAVLFSCNPVFSLLFAYLILRERIGRLNLISMLLSIAGLLIIVNPAKLTNPLGISLAVGSAVTFGLYSIVSRWSSVVSGFDGITMTSYTFIAGSIELLALILFFRIPAIANGLKSVSWMKSFVNVPILQNVGLHYFWILFFICVCVTGGGFAFYFLAMDRGGVSMASLVFFIKPGLAPVLALLILHETLSINTIVGILVILVSSIITFMGNRTKTDSSEMKDAVK
ncbi:DMT family transporter [Nicoliella spurrieriana]|uniref:DMT family transporter n=1 Tax=Nicoliella spurrieriana TaxID=2925830 RepID=A0A976X5T2_9LACO|nr:DMT family transporter [Nicoliella spurrieriana]UQS87029.1 DMT family transporter [Nicoliella spurrieriana]